MLTDLNTAERQLLAETLFPKGLSMAKPLERTKISAAKGIGVFIKKSGDDFFNNDDVNYMHKVFGTPGLNLSPTDYAVIDATELKAGELTDIIRFNNLQTVFCFNINPALLKINTRSPYTVVRHDGCAYVFAHDLNTFKQSVDFKRAMLEVLKSLFS